jgi:OOP family OmpA-OmpF porin
MKISGRSWGMAVLSVAAIAGAPVAGAQEAGTLELTGFGRFTNFSQTDKVGDKLGIGGEFGIFFADRFSVEVAASQTNTRNNLGLGESYLPLHLRLLYHQPLGSDRLVGLLGGGFVHDFYGRTARGGDNGGGVLAGLEALATDWFGIRLDATFDYTPSQFQFGGNTNTKFGVQAGLLFRLPHHTEAPPPPAPEPAPVAAAPAPPPPPPPPPVADADHDGVPDSVDACPNTPAGEPVDARGCSASQRDSDGDGVVDSKDKCPDTPPGVKVDSVGCPILAHDLVLEGVTFEVNKAVLLPQSSATLDRVAASLVANPTTRVEVRGYTDATGPAALNTRLSQARADAVREYLISKGVSSGNVVAKGFGPANPVASNATAAGRAQNRRVTLDKID